MVLLVWEMGDHFYAWHLASEDAPRDEGGGQESVRAGFRDDSEKYEDAQPPTIEESDEGDDEDVEGKGGEFTRLRCDGLI